MTLAAHALVFVGVAVVLVCCGKLLLPRDAFTRLHLLGTAGTLGAIPIVLGLVLSESASPPAWKSLLTLLLMLLYGPVLNQSLGRAAWLRERRRR